MTSVMRRVAQRLGRGRASVNRAPAASPDHGWVAAVVLIALLVGAFLLAGLAGNVR